jgi:hypothetical protein
VGIVRPPVSTLGLGLLLRQLNIPIARPEERPGRGSGLFTATGEGKQEPPRRGGFADEAQTYSSSRKAAHGWSNIEALLNDLGEMLKSALTGGPAAEDDPEEKGLTLGRYGSLSAFEAEFEVRASVEVLTAASDRLALETASNPGKPLPSAGARLAAPVQAAPAAAPGPPKPPIPSAAANPVADTVLTENEQTARRMADRIEESRLEPQRFLRLLKKYLRGLLREMRANQTIDGSQSARGESLLEKFFTRIETPSIAAESKEAESVSISLKTQHVSFSSYAYDFEAEVKLNPVLEETD